MRLKPGMLVTTNNKTSYILFHETAYIGMILSISRIRSEKYAAVKTIYSGYGILFHNPITFPLKDLKEKKISVLEKAFYNIAD